MGCDCCTYYYNIINEYILTFCWRRDFSSLLGQDLVQPNVDFIIINELIGIGTRVHVYL